MPQLLQISRTRALVLLVGLCLLAGCASPSARAQTTPVFSPTPTSAAPINPTPSSFTPTRDASASAATISVWGSGQATASPDRAIVTIGVESIALQASDALKQNNEQMLATLAALRKAGVAEDDIQTQAVQLYSRYEPIPFPPTQAEPMTATQSSGYTAVNTVQVVVRDISALGALLDAAVTAGGNRIDGIRFEVGDPKAAQQQARELAWQEAQQKAQQLADLSGMQLGQVVEIQETSSLSGDAAFQGAAGGPVPIAPGTQSLQINLNVTWEVH